VSKTA